MNSKNIVDTKIINRVKNSINELIAKKFIEAPSILEGKFQAKWFW